MLKNMYKAGDREQATSDLDGRLMALEQNARGLNARLRAVERSFSGDRLQLQSSTCTLEPVFDQPAFREPGMDDFVPAAEITIPYEHTGEHELKDTRPEKDENPIGTGGRKRSWLNWQPLDVTGLIAGLIMLLISILLYTGNVEVLKNPAMPFVFGVLLIGCVYLRRHYR
ncbi:hypothetical protein [Methanocella sp. MCL-LM]|uniref:hypothetical protein n=1 Tax=Methanocella sp. MCL-LM TaxID=3412035 RepID=UPI003C71D6FD